MFLSLIFPGKNAQTDRPNKTSAAIYGMLLTLAIIFIGDKIFASLLHHLNSSSNFRYSKIYNGTAQCDILLVGNSRGHALYQPAVRELTKASTLNISYNALPVTIANALVQDFYDLYKAPKAMIIEISLLVKTEGKVINAFKLYHNESARINSILAATSPSTFNGINVSNLYALNTELFHRSLYYLDSDDSDWIMDKSMNAHMVNSAGEIKEIQYQVTDENMADLKKLIQTAKHRNTDVRLVLAPYFRPYATKIKNLQAFIHEVQQATGTQVYNYATLFGDPELFSDYLHLNKQGSILFMERLKKDGILDGLDRVAKQSSSPEKEKIMNVKNNSSLDFDCRECDYVVKGYLTDGDKLGIKPGDVICLDGYKIYKALKFTNIKGTAQQPVVIRNCAAVATITEGIRFEQSSNFRLLGDGVKDAPYGIKVSIPKSFFVTFEKFTTDFEVARIEVAGLEPNGIGEQAGFAGIGIKTSPYQACDVFTDSTRTAWVMRNVNIHHNYIHDVGGEGLYIGHGFYKGRKEGKCPSKTWSHSIKKLRVHHNIIENTGYDGIQVKNADEDCEIHNNIIRNYGTQNHGAHNEGLILADGVTGKAYNNLIDTGTGHGIMFQGMGNNEIFNNIIVNAGQDGFNGTRSPTMGVYLVDGYYHFFHNTIINAAKTGFVYYAGAGGAKLVMNNLIIQSRGKLQGKGAKLQFENNVCLMDSLFSPVGLVTFKDRLPVIKEFKIAIDKGADISSYNGQLGLDFYNNQRPKGKGIDVGAVESQ